MVHDRSGAALPAAAISRLGARLAAMPHVVSVSPPRVSTSRSTALFEVNYDAR